MTTTTNNEYDEADEGATRASDDRTNESIATMTLASDKTSHTSNVAVPVGTSDPVAKDPADILTHTSGKATTSMVCGIISIVVFGIILGPIAICLALSAKREIREKSGQVHGECRVHGECQAQTGLICGIVAVVFWIIGLIAYAAS